MKNLIKNIPILGNLIKKLKHDLDIITNYLRIRWYVKQNDTLKIVIGASSVFENGWCPTDIENLNLLKVKSFNSLFKNRKIDVFLAEHVWEHLTPEDASEAAKNCHSYLNSGGYIRIAVPDGLHQDKNYINAVDVGGTGAGSCDHKVLYNYKTLSDVFKNAGFRVEPLEYFDEENNFQSNSWDKKQGMIHRSKRYDERNKQSPLAYTSIIIDAFKD